jgi:putative spermidine/putrescine transport system substrate-binding protein
MRTPRRLASAVAVAAAGLIGLVGCGGSGSDYDWKAAPDNAKIAAQGKDLPTYGLAPDWANYGEVVKDFCAEHGGTCAHKDTDMSSADEIQRFDAEQKNPVGTASDIGLMWGPVAEAKGVVPPYLPPSASKLKDWQKAKDGGWVATFVGAPSFVVNVDKVKNPPKTWADLLKPEYKGLVATKNPAASGTGQAMVVAAAYANGGSIDDLGPAFDYFAKLIWAPSGLMINKYNGAKGDFLKAFMDYVLSDKAQIAFARFGARPIRFLNGDLRLPADAKANWLPESSYAGVKEVPYSKVDPAKIVSDWEAKVVA